MKEHFSLAFMNLRRRKLRSWLTMTGIFIGIAAVVSLISLGQGLQNAIEQEFEELGKDKIIITSAIFASPGSASSKSIMLTDKDVDFIKKLKGVDDAAGILSKIGQVKSKGESKITYINGIDIMDKILWEDLNYFKAEEGKVFDEGEKFKAVVGYSNVYEDIWEKSLEIRGKLLIENVEFKISGVMKKTGDPSDDRAIYIPKETMKEIFDITDEESVIIAKTSPGFNPKEVAETILRKLGKFRGEKEGQETFSVMTSEQLLESFSNIFGIVQAILIGIATISLLVGGIGIMNTMYTSVLERTKEIGTMKAVGAKNKDILLIFLFEAGLLGLIGGLIGIGIGIGLGKSVEYFAMKSLGTNLLKASVNYLLVISSLLFSFLIGAISGVLPAIQASRLKPIDALRYE